jgi:hypothetical protein
MADETMDYLDGGVPNDYLNDWNDNHDNMPDLPMDDLPPAPRSMTLRQFCRRAKDLLNSNQTDFIRFVLTGKDTDGSQLFMDPILNRITSESSLNFIRDYDSLLGFSSKVRITTSLTIYPVPKNEDTLSHSIHIRHRFSTDEVSLSYHAHGYYS